MTTDAIAAAILTGGQARRMAGADKGALAVGGRTILERQLDVLRAFTTRIFVVGRAPLGLPADIAAVPDLIPAAGALGGIYSAIEASPCPRTLVVACDMPFLSPRLLEHLAGIDADLAIPRTPRGYEPLCAIYAKTCAVGIRDRIAHGDLQASIPPRDVRVVAVGPGELEALDPGGLSFVNVNTPHEYARARDLGILPRQKGKA